MTDQVSTINVFEEIKRLTQALAEKTAECDNALNNLGALELQRGRLPGRG